MNKTEARQMALANVLKRRLAQAGPGSHRIEFPGPQVVNNVPVPNVEVRNEVGVPSVTVSPADLGPLGDMLGSSLDRFSAAVIEQARVLAGLELRVVNNQAAPVVNVEGAGDVAGVLLSLKVLIGEQIASLAALTSVLRDLLAPPAKRTLRVEHDDGTVSVVREV